MSKSERTLKTREREKQALSMRRAGATYQQIADALEYGNPSNAHRAVFRALDRIPVEDAKELRTVECARLDALQAAHWRLAVGGNTKNARIILQVMERRARLLGLDAPTKVELTDDMDAQIRALAAELGNDGTWDVTGIPGDDDERATLALLDEEDAQ